MLTLMCTSEAAAPCCGESWVERGGLLCCTGPCRHSSHRVNTVKHCTMPLGTARSRHGPRMKPRRMDTSRGRSEEVRVRQSKTPQVLNFKIKGSVTERGVELTVPVFLSLHLLSFSDSQYTSSSLRDFFLCYCWQNIFVCLF